MSELVAWLPLVSALAAAGALFGVVGAMGALFASRKRLDGLAPGLRFWTLAILCALPAGIAILLVSISFAPSALDALGLVPDHCMDHAGHAFHLCFVHGTAPDALWPLGAGAIVAARLLPALARELVGAFRTGRWIRQLRQLGRYDHSSGAWLLEGLGLAFTLGFTKPVIFASAEADSGMSSSHYDAVLAHEREHARRRDALVKSLCRILASLHLPSVRDDLLGRLDLAAEQACDEAAAAHVGDRVTVAEAIVAFSRLTPATDAPVTALGFGQVGLEERVRGMLRRGWWTPPTSRLAAIPAAAVGLIAVTYERLHHDFESILSYLI